MATYDELMYNGPSLGQDYTDWSNQVYQAQLATPPEAPGLGQTQETWQQQVAQTQQQNATANAPAGLNYVATGDNGNLFTDQSGGIVTLNQQGTPLNYEPSTAWYNQQLAANPGLVRNTDYKNQTYLSSAGLPQTYNFNGTEVPMNLTEWQIDPKTGKLAQNAAGQTQGVQWRPDTGGFNNWFLDNGWVIPAAGMAAVGGAAAAGLLGAEGLGAAGATGALETSGAGGLAGGGAFTPAAGSGASFGLPGFAGGAAGGAVGQALPYTEAFDAINLTSQGLSTEAVAQNLAATGMNDFLAYDVANLAAQGLSEAQISQIIGASYSAPELAGTAFESLGWAPEAAASSLSMSDLLKGLGSLKGSGLTAGLKQGATSGLANSLGKLATGQTGMGMDIPGLIRGNQNPFLQTQSTPLQTPQKVELSTIADLLRQK